MSGDWMACGGEQFPLHASCPHSGPPVPVSLLEVSCFIIIKAPGVHTYF